jgi:hypothetical protein
MRLMLDWTHLRQKQNGYAMAAETCGDATRTSQERSNDGDTTLRPKECPDGRK